MARVPATQLSLEYLTGHGCRCAIVERSIASKPFPVKQDMFGLFDIVSVSLSPVEKVDRVSFIQTTSYANLSSRRKKLEAEQELLSALIDAGIRIYLHGWEKTGGSYEITCERATRVERGKIVMARVKVNSMKALRAYVKSRDLDGN